jgi:hypothetical protein
MNETDPQRTDAVHFRLQETVSADEMHECLRHAHRIKREGLVDFLFRLIGLYPWQCNRCRRSFRRHQRLS